MDYTWVINHGSVLLPGFQQKSVGKFVSNGVYAFQRETPDGHMLWPFLESEMKLLPTIFSRVCGWGHTPQGTCVSPSDLCENRKGILYCTRERGHEGAHVACRLGGSLDAPDAHPILVWSELPQEGRCQVDVEIPDPDGTIDYRPILAHGTPLRTGDPKEVRVLCLNEKQAPWCMV